MPAQPHLAHLFVRIFGVSIASQAGKQSNAHMRFPFKGRECCLTIRSTGAYTACRHLARHFILGQIPSRCSGPVSSNVRFHKPQHRRRA